MAKKPCKPCSGRGWKHEESCKTVDYRKRGIMTVMEVECDCQRPTCPDCLGSGVMIRHKDRP